MAKGPAIATPKTAILCSPQEVQKFLTRNIDLANMETDLDTVPPIRIFYFTLSNPQFCQELCCHVLFHWVRLTHAQGRGRQLLEDSKGIKMSDWGPFDLLRFDSCHMTRSVLQHPETHSSGWPRPQFLLQTVTTLIPKLPREIVSSNP